MRGLSALLLIALTGCSADRPLNPSFPLLLADAREAIRDMERDRLPLERPVIILGGIHDPGIAAPSFARRLRRIATDDAQIVSVSFFGTGTFDDCRRKAIDVVCETFPGSDPQETVEVDVVGISMGGLVARYAARPHRDDPRRLRIRRLFTIGTPHLGARLARIPTIDARVLDMRSGSEFLAELDVLAETDPDLLPYTRLGDAIVGERNSAPPDRQPWWVANIPFTFSHLMSARDPRFLADIGRRLRGQTPFTTMPPTPLPEAPGGPSPP